MAERGYKVVQYDASIDKAPYNHPNITFIRKFVGTKDSDDVISFERVISQNNLSKDSHNILQIDIEDAEWDILEAVDLGAVAEYCPQIILEFHYCNPSDESLMQKRLPILEKMLQHYTPIHTHFNNYGTIFYNEGLFWGDVVEVSYLRKDLVPKDSVFATNGYVNGLDSPNNPGFADIPIIFR